MNENFHAWPHVTGHGEKASAIELCKITSMLCTLGYGKYELTSFWDLHLPWRCLTTDVQASWSLKPKHIWSRTFECRVFDPYVNECLCRRCCLEVCALLHALTAKCVDASLLFPLELPQARGLERWLGKSTFCSSRGSMVTFYPLYWKNLTH